MNTIERQGQLSNKKKKISTIEHDRAPRAALEQEEEDLDRAKQLSSKMGRFPTRRSRRGGRGHGRQADSSDKKSSRSTGSSTNTSTKSSTSTTLKDCVFNFGSAKNAGDYASTELFILNHIRKTYKEGEDIALAMEKGADIDFTTLAPTMQLVTADPKTEPALYETQKLQYTEDYKMQTAHYHDRIRLYRQNKSSIAALLMGRCSSSMKSQLQSRTNWEQIEKDPVPLLAAIREHSLNYDSTKYRMKIILDALKILR